MEVRMAAVSDSKFHLPGERRGAGSVISYCGMHRFHFVAGVQDERLLFEWRERFLGSASACRVCAARYRAHGGTFERLRGSVQRFFGRPVADRAF